jgi:ubiquitin
MGALRINKTNGTSVFLDLSNYVSAKIGEAQFERTLLDFTKQDGGSEIWSVQRFITSPECVWRYQMRVAYKAIAAAPIKYGYPDLGTQEETYVTYDASKFGTAALEQALTDQQEDNIPYTEKTAICPLVTDPDSAEALEEEINTIKDQATAESEALENECSKAIDAGNTFTWPEIGVVCDSAACCAATRNVYRDYLISKNLDEKGIIIEHKHQYLWLDVTTEGP